MNAVSEPWAYRGVVTFPVGPISLEGNLEIPRSAGGVILFAHGSGSSRHSRRNQHVARQLQQGGLGTLLIDLLTSEEEDIDLRTRELRFDIDLLAQRVVGATGWLASHRAAQGMSIGLFGASTGAAAALVAAAERPDAVAAVVSRGGRPDLALEHLPRVQVPTLLIVGARDTLVINLNRAAMPHLGGEKRLEIIPGASHLFEEPGALDEVARLAREWFQQYLRRDC